MKKCQYAVVALCQAPYLLDDPNVGMIFPRAKHYPFLICKLISAYSDSRGLLGARKASSSLLFVIFISQRGNALFQEVLVYATILLLTLLLWLFAPPNFLIRLELLLIDKRLHWSEPCMALRMSFEASLFREPHHFSTKNKDIHRFTDHQFTISFSHNSVLSAANCLRDMECQEEVDIPKAFVNPGGDFGIVPAQLVLMSKDHNIHCFSAAILRRADECKCDQEASPEKAIHHNLTDLSFLPCPCGFVYVSSPLFRSTKTMDVAHDGQLPQTSMRGQVVTVLYFLVISLVSQLHTAYCLSTEFVLLTLLHLLKV
ncbi:unnamed protein product [Brassica oleracea]|uniref:(rape) hypothetical protein n=1 Tax=Brassica napus TaxID=3708 RepID=A0A816RDC3_BRANA|nr:unnamed protein product [Brassica napus]